jgi:hypothetical protein
MGSHPPRRQPYKHKPTTSHESVIFVKRKELGVLQKLRVLLPAKKRLTPPKTGDKLAFIQPQKNNTAHPSSNNDTP